MWNPFSDATQGAVKGFGEAIAEVAGAFKANPTEVLKFQADMEAAALKFQEQAIIAVNATMQAESKSEHWAQWLWRPTIGFTFAGVLINNYILVAYFASYGVVSIPVPGEVWTAMLVILGAAAAGRSWEKAKEK